jgi:hypothetical protein
MKKKRGKTQGKARRRATKDLTARQGGGVKAGERGSVQFQEFHITKRNDL